MLRASVINLLIRGTRPGCLQITWSRTEGGQPFKLIPRLEFRIGSPSFGNPRSRDIETSVHGQIRLLF
jgi:hypothetical protein